MARSAYRGFNPPFIGPNGNVLSPQTDVRLIQNDLIQLLLTIPGERRMRPTFGTQLRNFVFEPGDQASIDALSSGIRTKISQFEPRVTVVELQFTFNDDTNTLNLKLIGSVTLDRDSVDQFLLEVGVPVQTRV